MGMIPFFVGDVIDFFHRANIQNMQMIQGFVDIQSLRRGHFGHGHLVKIENGWCQNRHYNINIIFIYSEQ
jgi:hypothetical protein